MLRPSLESRDRAWLIEEVLRLTLADVSLQEIVRIDQQVQLAAQEQQHLTQTALERETRVERVRALKLDERDLNLLLERLGGRERAVNVVMEVEYGEVASEAVGSGVAACLRLINDPEVNGVILYNRMTDIESSSL